LQKLFQEDIENIKNAKSDTDNKLSQIFAKNIKTVSTDLLASSISFKFIDGFNQHDKIQT